MAIRNAGPVGEAVTAWDDMRGVQPQRGVRRIVRSYSSWIVQVYCVIRFRILRIRFLEEIGQYLPTGGRVMEVGCGFGLFALYFASIHPDLQIRAVDLDEKRIAAAEASQHKLGINNVSFEIGDATQIDLGSGPLDAVYMLDLIHHIPPVSARQLVHQAYEVLRPGGVLIIKDVDTRPRWKMTFTLLLDLLMTGGERPDYWSSAELADLLQGEGFKVFRHSMVDLLPYPHQLFVAIKGSETDPASS